MISFESIVKYNAQSVGRERLISNNARLSQFVTKFVNSILHIYYTRYAKGGNELLEFIYKLRELEQYFISCRRLLTFGRCTDQFYLALRSMQIYDPVHRMTITISKFSSSIQMFADHVLWLHQMGFLKGEKQPWIERANKFWLYSVTMNLLRDTYELICVVQQKRTRNQDNLDSALKKFTLSTPIKWAKNNPKLSCDLIKNFSEFWIPCSAVNQVKMHPSIIAMLGIISTSMGILQAYDKKYRLSPS